MWFIVARHKKEKYFKNIALGGDWTGLNDSYYCLFFKTTVTQTAYFWKVEIVLKVIKNDGGHVCCIFASFYLTRLVRVKSRSYFR